MADSAKIKYAGSVSVSETLEALDTNNTVTLIHSKIDSTLGGSNDYSLTGVEELSYETGLATTTSYVDVDFSSGEYDGMGGNTEAAIKFLFVKIDSAASTGTPDCHVKVAGVDAMIQLSGAGDFCIVPLGEYDNATNRIAVKSSEATELANITILAAK